MSRPLLPAHARTFIIAPTIFAARALAREVGVGTHAKTTVLVSRPDALRGHTIRPADRVLWSVAPWPSGSWRVLDEIEENLRLARLVGGSA